MTNENKLIKNSSVYQFYKLFFLFLNSKEVRGYVLEKHDLFCRFEKSFLRSVLFALKHKELSTERLDLFAYFVI
jgi:hypothetical protein